MSLLDDALAYAERAWPVFPCHTWTEQGSCTCGDRNCSSPAKHPRTEHGLYDATTQANVILGWWVRWPQANIGIRTGVRFDVLDVDGPEGELALPRDLPDSETVDGPTVATGKGTHVYVATTGRGNKTRFRPGLDWRGKGGYVIAPPSVHESGAVYRWEQPDDPDFGPDAPIRPAPAWLLELLDPPASKTLARTGVGARVLPRDTYGRRALEGELGRLAVAPVGTRNADLHKAAVRLGQLVASGQVEACEVVDALLNVGARVGLAEREVEGTVRSGMRFGMENPRA